jgi:hypothetical protein
MKVQSTALRRLADIQVVSFHQGLTVMEDIQPSSTGEEPSDLSPGLQLWLHHQINAAVDGINIHAGYRNIHEFQTNRPGTRSP